MSDTELSTLVDVLAVELSPTVDKATLSSLQSMAYLTYLTNLPLDALVAEPTNLSSTSSQLTNALTILCTSSYPTFLSMHTATSGLQSILSSFSTSLEGLIHDIPLLEDSARAFSAEVNGVQAERRRAALVLEHSAKLQDILELPQLAEACVRHGYFQEALDLSAHSLRLAARFPAVRVVQDVRAEVDQAVRGLLVQLLGMLPAPAKLPALFKAVSFLRRMRVLTEDELALAFLAGRLEYLELALQAVALEQKGADHEHDKETWVRYVRRYIDVWREGVHDVVTQYTTIFLERSSSPSSSSRPATPVPAAPATGPTPAVRAFLPTFTTRLISRLLTVLRDALPRIPEPTALNATLTQLTYCATSFARSGLDFRLLLPPLFSDAVLGSTTRALWDATDTWCAACAGSAADKPSAWLVVANGSDSFPTTSIPPRRGNNKSNHTPPHIPPQALAAYPPLAAYTNTILKALNNLRLLAPAALLSTLVGTLDAVLVDAVHALLAYVRRADTDTAVRASLPTEETRVLRASVWAFVWVFVPFVRRALAEGVYGVETMPLNGELETVVGDAEVWVAQRE